MDSPRGRIVLMRVGHEDAAEVSDEMVTHFDRCLGCMACVTACPSGRPVRQADRADAAADRAPRRPAAARARLAARRSSRCSPTRAACARSRRCSRFQQRTGHQRRARQAADPEAAGAALARPRRVAASAAVRQLPEVTPARGESRGRIALMQGCVQRVFFGDVNAATVRVLAAEGFEVHAPRKPRCCGSLMMHAGLEEEALVLARETIAAYEDFDAIGVNVAGCGSGMKDYAHLLADDPEWAERAEAFSAKVKDVSELLAGEEPRVVRHPLRAEGRLPRRLPPRPRPGRARRAARAAALDPRARARRARRVADLLRLGRDLQPRAARGGGEARPAQGRQPRRHRARRDRRRPTRAARCRSPGISIVRSRSTTR